MELEHDATDATRCGTTPHSVPQDAAGKEPAAPMAAPGQTTPVQGQTSARPRQPLALRGFRAAPTWPRKPTQLTCKDTQPPATENQSPKAGASAVTQPRSYLIIPLIGGGALAPRDADAQPPRLPHDGQCQLEAEGTVVMGQCTQEQGTTLLIQNSNSKSSAATLGEPWHL